MDDGSAIRTLIGEHFEAMRWADDSESDWDRFRQDFLAEASCLAL